MVDRNEHWGLVVLVATVNLLFDWPWIFRRELLTTTENAQ